METFHGIKQLCKNIKVVIICLNKKKYNFYKLV